MSGGRSPLELCSGGSTKPEAPVAYKTPELYTIYYQNVNEVCSLFEDDMYVCFLALGWWLTTKGDG